MKNLSIILLGFISLFSCTKEISVSVNHEPQTVIFGTISNENKPVTIHIQQSVPLNSSATSQPVNDASILLYTKTPSGTTELLTDDFTVSQGTYTSTTIINTNIGNYYWIEVVLSNGTQFRSAEELLKPVVPINELEITNEDILEITFNDPADDINFYKFTVDLFNNGVHVSNNASESNDVVFNGNDNATVEIDLFRGFDDEDEDIFIEYDEIRVTLCNINFGSYQFYLNQSLQIESNDSESSGDPSQLFATPPVNLLGNISNNTTALGNFTVNAITTENQVVDN